jgi:hypothetical protein
VKLDLFGLPLVCPESDFARGQNALLLLEVSKNDEIK